MCFGEKLLFFCLFKRVICRLYIPCFKSIIQRKDIKIVDEGEVSKLSNGPGEYLVYSDIFHLRSQ